MIKSADVWEEIKGFEAILEKIKSGKADEKDVKWAMLKSQVIIIKLLHNIRSNQVEQMRNQGVPLKQSKRTDAKNEKK